MRIGLFGGTFDPPHIGHLLAASDAFDALGLHRLVFIPATRQPLKSVARQATAADRLAMTRLATSGDDRFAVDAREVERGGTSFTVDTLEALAAESPGEAYFFLVGADVGATFAQWRSPRRITELARVGILSRADGEGADAVPAALAVVRQVSAPGVPGPLAVPTRRVDVSSTEVRRRVQDGRPIHGFVTEAVARFIVDRGLYRQDTRE